MTEATLTSKGQVTVPVEVRRQLGLKAGDRLLFEVVDDVIRVRVVPKRALSLLHGVLPPPRPYVGVQEAREEVGRELARRRRGSR